MAIEPKVGHYYLSKGPARLVRKILHIINGEVIYVDQCGHGRCYQNNLVRWAKEEVQQPSEVDLVDIERSERRFLGLLQIEFAVTRNVFEKHTIRAIAKQIVE